jgi:hypothetical protein
MNPQINKVFGIPDHARIEKVGRTWVCNWEENGTPFYLVLEDSIVRLRVGELEKDQIQPYRNWIHARTQNLNRDRGAIRRDKHEIVVEYRKYLKSIGVKIKVKSLVQDLEELVEKHRVLSAEIEQSKDEWLLELSQAAEKLSAIFLTYRCEDLPSADSSEEQ